LKAEEEEEGRAVAKRRGETFFAIAGMMPDTHRPLIHTSNPNIMNMIGKTTNGPTCYHRNRGTAKQPMNKMMMAIACELSWTALEVRQ
jgi:hypothetical protein